MSIRSAEMYFVVCDSCKAEFDYEDGGGTPMYRTEAAAVDAADEFAEHEDGWTTDGEGKHHCEKCPRLVITEAGLALRARRVTEADVPLFGVGS